MNTERKYPSELTNRQWQLIRQLLPPRAPRGRRPIDRRRAMTYLAMINLMTKRLQNYQYSFLKHVLSQHPRYSRAAELP